MSNYLQALHALETAIYDAVEEYIANKKAMPILAYIFGWMRAKWFTKLKS